MGGTGFRSENEGAYRKREVVTHERHEVDVAVKVKPDVVTYATTEQEKNRDLFITKKPWWRRLFAS